MPPAKPTPSKPDLADKIVAALSEAKERALADSRTFTRANAAQLVRLILIESLQPAPRRSGHPKSSKPCPFGDRQAIPPTPEQVAAYSASIGYPIEGDAFCDFYTSKGWVVGKAKMKDWQACCRTWKRQRYNAISKAASVSIPKDYTKL